MPAEQGVPRPVESELTLVIDTPTVKIVRRVQPARTLPEQTSRGKAVEDAARLAAAAFGLPDFVFRASVRPTGSGIRELGDAIVTVGDVAAAVQVKARTVPSDNLRRERAWFDRNINKAARQAGGTIRRLSDSSETLVNERGRRVRVDGKLKSWVGVVVLDHARPPPNYLPPPTATRTCVVLLRRDWEFLFDQLRSTDAVVRYLHRVSAMDPVALGEEPVRYYDLASADAAAEPTPLLPSIAALGGRGVSTPVLPFSLAEPDEWRYQAVLRVVMEDIATAPRAEEYQEADVVDVLAAVDSLPVGERTELGKALMGWLDATAPGDSEGLKWRFRRVVCPGRPPLVFATVNHWSKEIQGAFGTYLELRHQQLVD